MEPRCPLNRIASLTGWTAIQRFHLPFLPYSKTAIVLHVEDPYASLLLFLTSLLLFFDNVFINPFREVVIFLLYTLIPYKHHLQEYDGI